MRVWTARHTWCSSNCERLALLLTAPTYREWGDEVAHYTVRN